MNRLFDLRTNRFLRSVALLMTGAGVAQTLNLLVLPFLTKLYTPLDFKVFAVFTALAIITSLGSCLGFDFALPFAKSEEDGANILVCAVLGVVAVSSLVGLATIAAFAVNLTPRSGGYESFTWLLPSATLLIGWTNAFEYWSTYRKRFQLISQCRIGQVATGAAVQLAMGVGGGETLGLLVGYVLMGAAALFILAGVTWMRDRAVLASASLSGMRRVISGYASFPRFTAVESVASACSLYLPVLIISAALPGPEAGFIGLAMRIVQSPLFLVSRSVSQVYLSEARESADGGRLREDTARVLRNLIGLVTGPLIAAAILAPVFVPLVLGPAWRLVGVYIAWIMPWAYAQFLATAILITLYALKKNAHIMWLTLFGLALRASAAGIAALWFKPWVIATYAASGAVFYGLSLAIFMQANRVRVLDILPRGRLASLGLTSLPLAAGALKLVLAR